MTQEMTLPILIPPPVGYSPDEILDSFFEMSCVCDGKRVAIRHQPRIGPNCFVVASAWNRFSVVEVVGCFPTKDEAKAAAKSWVLGE
jgi:hypothetical protein